MRKIVIGVSIFFLMFTWNAVPASGQLYNTGVGARLGFFNGITVKHFLQEGHALEGILSTRWNGLIITGLYEIQRPFTDVTNLEWYYGGGAHVGFWQEGRYRSDLEASSVFGLDLILGVEYTIDEVPFSVSLDWKPGFNILGDNRWWGDGVALSIRYTFR
jgi:hypothetical protein